MKAYIQSQVRLKEGIQKEHKENKEILPKQLQTVETPQSSGKRDSTEARAKGKCSNEKGITLATNFGKLFERILNNRATRKPSRRTEGQSNNRPHDHTKGNHQRNMQTQKSRIHSISGCHEIIRQGLAGCYNVCDAQSRPKTPSGTKSKEWTKHSHSALFDVVTPLYLFHSPTYI